MKYFNLIALFALVSIFSVSCNRVESPEDSYVRLSVSSHTYYYDDTAAVRINVKSSSSEWTVKADEDWIIVDERNENGVVVSVKNNDGEQWRSGSVIFTCGDASSSFSVEQMPFFFDGTFFEFSSTCIYPAVSPKGKYMASMRIDGPKENDLYEYIPTYVNVETGEVTECAPEKDYELFAAISDDARVMVFNNAMQLWSKLVVDGEEVKINLPENCSNPYIEAVSSDGSVMVGWMYVGLAGQGKYSPARWVNGEPEVLDAPETDLWGYELYAGSYARGCSADGSVIYGGDAKTAGTIWWVDGKMKSIMDTEYYVLDKKIIEDSFGSFEISAFKGTQNYSSNNCMSPNGKYLATQYQDFSWNGNSYDLTYHPAVINIETGKVDVFFDLTDGKMITVDNDGRCYGTNTTLGMGSPLIFDMTAGTSESQIDWLLSEYGLNVSGNRHIWYVSEDNSTIFGVRVVGGGVGGLQFVPWYFKPAK